MSIEIPQNPTKETSILNIYGNKIVTENKVIEVIAKYDEPLVIVLGSVLTDDECEALIQTSKNQLKRSKIGVSRDVSEIRTSSGTFLDYLEDPVVARIEKRISEFTGIPIEYGEGLHILNYKVDQEYKAHFDYFQKTSKAANNNRIATVILYLNDVEEGGETHFPNLNLSIFPKKGMAVYFEYFYTDQTLNELTLHGGAPVVEGEKWIATQWLRRKQYER